MRTTKAAITNHWQLMAAPSVTAAPTNNMAVCELMYAYVCVSKVAQERLITL